MSDQLYTAIITDAPRLNYLAMPDVPTAVQGMFTTSLSADGLAPATHWVSSGYMSADDIQLLLNNGIEQYVGGMPLIPMYAWDAINDAGLQLVQEPIDG